MATQNAVLVVMYVLRPWDAIDGLYVGVAFV